MKNASIEDYTNFDKEIVIREFSKTKIIKENNHIF